MANEIVFAFDFGTSSLGEAVRKGDFIDNTAALLADAEVGTLADQRKRRRAFRTRESHLAREESLKRTCAEAGVPILAHDDPRMLREFPKKDNDTCYTSCLLRIKLLRGEPLEGWQIYKALHSAIQRRGYDPKENLPWAKKSEKTNKPKSKEEKEFDKNLEEFKKEFNSLPDVCQYLCYFDARKMGLWKPEEKDVFHLRIKCHAERARKHLITRAVVLKEVRALLQAAARIYPKLEGRYDEIMFGKGGKEYASYKPELRKKFGLRRGAKSDWDGILGQKVPRFDNRIIGKCVLMPRRNVCRAEDGLVQQVRFLLQAKNMRFERDDRDDMLAPDEMSKLLQSVLEKEKKKKKKEKEKKESENANKTMAQSPCKLTPTQWKTFVVKIGGNPKSAEDEIKPPSVKGRARFCRPALRLLREMLTTGISPQNLHARCKREIEEGSQRLNMEDLDFLNVMPPTWESFHIPDSKLDTLLGDAGGDANRAIVNLISGQINPVVRHRLFFFYAELHRLRKKHGVPDKVALEFVRDDFMGKKAKQQYSKFLKSREEKNKNAQKELEENGLNAKSSKNRLKMKLFTEQNGICLYTGESLSERELESYDIDHVVPRSRNGSDSYLNSTLTTAKANRQEKKDQTPYEWLHGGTAWEAYLNRVNAAKISKKKKRLLTAENAAELDKKYTGLAETAWIAKLARKIVCLYFGWPEGKPEEPRRCQIISGGLTARVRARYHLNEILSPEDLPPKDREKKFRDDKRHHALDAMVLSYLSNWASDKSKRDFFAFPKSIGNPADYFSEQIDKVIPETVFRAKPKLEETFYGKRTIYETQTINGKRTIVGKNTMMVYARELKTLPYKTEKKKKAFKPPKNRNEAGTIAEKIIDKRIRRDVKEVLEGLADVADKAKQEKIWLDFVAHYRLDGPNGKGPCVKKVACISGDPIEYHDFRKEQTSDLGKKPPRGQFRKGEKHQGYFIVATPEGKSKVEPVYVFESLTGRRKAILEEYGDNVLDFFFSGCLVVVDNEARAGSTVIQPGVYRCGTITTQGNISLEKEGTKYVMNLNTFLQANPQFRRFKRKE